MEKLLRSDLMAGSSLGKLEKSALSLSLYRSHANAHTHTHTHTHTQIHTHTSVIFNHALVQAVVVCRCLVSRVQARPFSLWKL